MDKKQYDLVIKLTENSNDSVALFYRLSALVAVGQSEEALKLINSKRLILQKRLDILIKVHLEILCLLGRFDEAYDELKYYQELPYESQVVEEILKAMPEYIRKEERGAYSHHEKNEEQIISLLMSKNDEEVLAALDAIKNEPLNHYLLPILKIMRSHPRQVVRSFALLLLVNNKYDKEVDFLDGEKLIKVIPASFASETTSETATSSTVPDEPDELEHPVNAIAAEKRAIANKLNFFIWTSILFYLIIHNGR